MRKNNSIYPQDPAPNDLSVREQKIEAAFIETLGSPKSTVHTDIRDPASLELNIREKFETLNRVRLTDAKFERRLDELITHDVFTAARVLREKNDFTHDDGTSFSCTLKLKFKVLIPNGLCPSRISVLEII